MDLDNYIIFAFIPLAIFIVLLVHELGHFAAARLFGLPIDEVSIGAGREIWSRTDRKNTLWRVHLYPIKAHVHVVGFDDETKPLWQRFLTVLAGPVTNLIFPFFVFAAFFLLVGQPSTPAILVGVEVNDAADNAGLRVGDEIVAVNGIATHRYKDVKAQGYDHTRDNLYAVRRGDAVEEIIFRPSYLEFIDTEGIERAYPRLGVIWRHKAFKFKAFSSINGVDVDGDKEKIRTEIMKNMDRDIVLGLNSNDGTARLYKAHIYAASNPHINDPDHKDYEHVYLGAAQDDFYYKDTPLRSIAAALDYHMDLMGKVLGVPFQLFPIDKEAINPKASVEAQSTWLANKIYHFIHKMALISFVVAFVNLLPLPYMDGSYLIFYLIEAVTKKNPSKRVRARALAGFFFVIYLAMMMANLDNVPRYIDSRVKKIHDFIGNKN